MPAWDKSDVLVNPLCHSVGPYLKRRRCCGCDDGRESENDGLKEENQHLVIQIPYRMAMTMICQATAGTK